jgi:hypothetical protein
MDFQLRIDLLLRNANDLETGAIDTVDEVGSSDDQRRDCSSVGGEEGNKGEYRSFELSMD